MSLHVAALVVRTAVESVERQKFAIRPCRPRRVARLFTVCFPCPLESVQEFPDVLVLFDVIFTHKPIVDGENAGRPKQGVRRQEYLGHTVQRIDDPPGG